MSSAARWRACCGFWSRRQEPVLEAVAPNYHHLQHSGFGTLGEYLLSWVPVFLPHLERLEQVEQRLDYGPSVIGARKEVHALYDKVSQRLGFSRRAWLRRDGIWVHSQFTEPFFALSLVAVDIAPHGAGHAHLDDAGVRLLRARGRAFGRKQRLAARQGAVRLSGGHRRRHPGGEPPGRRDVGCCRGAVGRVRADLPFRKPVRSRGGYRRPGPATCPK